MSAAIIYEQGREVGTVGIFQDLRERIRIEKEVRAVAGAERVGSVDWKLAMFLQHLIVEERARETCRQELWYVATLGWHARFGMVAELQAVGTPQARADILRRFGRLASFFDQEVENLREGLRTGRSASRVSVLQTLTQLDALLDAGADNSPYMSPA